MKPDRLLQHFEQVAEAPDAVPRLRRFILDLAVRGKLVEQNPADEPVSKLLERIEADEKRLIKGGTIRKQKSVAPIGAEDSPYGIPTSWVWVRLGSIGDWGSGSTPPRGSSEYYAGGITWLKSGELEDKIGLRGSEETVTEAALQRCSFRLNKPGDVLIAMYGATIGKLAILGEPAVTNQAVCGCTPFEGILNRYLFLYLLSRREDFHAQSEGGAQPNISKVKIVNSFFPLPPLAEQHRIVAKVDELMALCDELGAAQAKRERRRDRLVAATLHGLNNGDGSAEPGTRPTFEDSARFYFNHLPRLTTRPEHIHQLRQTILNLAVRGKLVPEVGRDQSLAPKVCDAPFHLPVSWQWKAVADLGDTQTGSTPPTAERKHYGGSIPFIKPAAINDSIINFEGQGLTESGARESTHVEAGAILMVCIGGSIGKAAIVDWPVCFNQQINSVSPTEEAHPRFVLLAMRSPYFQERVLDTAAKGTLPIISKGKWERLSIPLPPLAEQHRIVAKVDELMALCDDLEARLTTTATTRRQLLEAILDEAPVGSS